MELLFLNIGTTETLIAIPAMLFLFLQPLPRSHQPGYTRRTPGDLETCYPSHRPARQHRILGYRAETDGEYIE